MLGFDRGSWGFHGTDGCLFEGWWSAKGRKYDAPYTTGDVIGCGVNFGEGIAFYTKNGKVIGTYSTLPISCQKERLICNREGIHRHPQQIISGHVLRHHTGRLADIGRLPKPRG